MRETPKISDELKFYDNIQDFFKSIENRLITYWVYKKGISLHDKDVSLEYCNIYEDCVGKTGMIKEVALLPDTDILLGIAQDIELTDGERNYYMDYYKLSEIHIAYNQYQEQEYINELQENQDI